jgi:hypothetical protein
LKSCFKCGDVKPLAEFYGHPMMGDRHLGKCKTCTKADTRARAVHPDRVAPLQAYEKARNALPHRVAARLAYQKTERGKAASAKARRNYAARNAGQTH